ncbi:MAG: carboxyl transferase domain-containing protein [Ilumatobacteraceae bacterium]
MTWEPEIGELDRRLELVAGMDGPEGITRQHSRNKLTVRERLPLLADPGTFEEFGRLRGEGTNAADGRLDSFTPQGKVDGMCTVDGRKVVVTAGDFTVRGGSASGSHGGLGEELSASQRALEWRLPYVRLIDNAGGSVRNFETLGRTYLPDANSFTHTDVSLLNAVPVVSAVLGAAAGIGALHTSLAHWNVMVDNTQVFPGGPPVVKAALGYDITKEDLGGPQIHVRESGVVDNLAASEEDAFRLIRRFLSYLPSSVDEMAPRGEASDPVDRRAGELLDLVPREPRRVHNARKLIELVVDEGSFFPIAPLYGRSRITGLARVNGYPVGVMANDPMFLGGATDVAAGLKAARLMQLCELFHLPLVDLADEPGLMVGLDSEKQGIERAGARLVCITNACRMPWITIVVRRLYGVGGQTHHRSTGMFRRYAWPSARWGSMHIAGGASAAYRREIEAADDPDAKRQEIEDRLNKLGSPFRTAEATGQDIIDPRDTRPLIADFVADAQRVLVRQLGPPVLPYLP